MFVIVYLIYRVLYFRPPRKNFLAPSLKTAEHVLNNMYVVIDSKSQH